MCFADAKIVAQQINDPSVNILLQKLEEYNIPDNQAVYVITSVQINDALTVESLNVSHLLSLANATLMFQEIKNATQGIFGIWSTHGFGYGWPPGIHVVQPGEKQIFLWYYPNDTDATTIIWMPIFPVPIFHGPHAGGVVATFPSGLKAPTIDAAPGLVIGGGKFLFGICIPFNGASIQG